MSTFSEAGRRRLAFRERCRLEAYADSTGLPTIGFGNTRYEDGTRVKMGDRITPERALDLFHRTAERFAAQVDELTTDAVTPTQFDELVSLAYNIGLHAYEASSVRHLVNQNPNDPAIRNAFMAYHYSKGKPIPGLWNRRHKEADTYFGVTTPLPKWPHPAPTD